jgi:hypothetical protein
MGLTEQVAAEPECFLDAAWRLEDTRLVVILTTARRTSGDKPKLVSPRTTWSSHARHVGCCGKSARNA